MRRSVVVVALVLVLAGCTAPGLSGDDPTVRDDGLGVVDGVAYDEEISISTEDGLNETELDVLIARSMARLEVLRERPFEEHVEVEVQNRTEYREMRADWSRDTTSRAWENRVWQAMFIVGTDRDVTDALDGTLGEAVQGYYEPGSEQIVVVSSGNESDVNVDTLVHELVHALQDQQFGLDSAPKRQDPALARNGLIEGEAELLTEKYFERCESEWECLEPTPPDGDSSSVDPGIIQVIIHPYQEGPEFVESIVDRDGWESVDALHDAVPESTSQIIDPSAYPDRRPINVTVEDRSSEDWSRLDHDPVGETIGEAALYVMFFQNGVIETEDPYEYSHPVSDGWMGDKLVPYTTEANESGYVWELEWESNEEAAQFHDAYLDLLEERGALERGPRQFVIPEGPFAGAFDIRVDGNTVTIVKGPDVDSVSEIHPAED